MFTFAYPGLLFLLFLIPVIGFIFLISRYRRKKNLQRFGDPKTLAPIMPDASPYKAGVRIVIALLALSAIIFALARPWGGIKNQETSREGIEIVIAVDASNSMLASATAEEGGPDRMKMAKLMLEKLINRLGNDKVGLIAFAGDAYTLIPVTNDYISAKAFLNSIDPSLLKFQGTNIGATINLAENSFSEKGDIGKAIILLTDAEELQDAKGVIDEVARASKRGIQTDVIGIGSNPVTIPDARGGRMIDDETGEVVRTALNEDLALDIAKAGKGIYVNASNDEAVDELIKQLGGLKRVAMESSFLVSHDEMYFPFVIFAIVLIIIDFLLTDKKNRWLNKISFFSKYAPIIISVPLITISLSGCKENNEDNSVNISPERTSKRDSLLQIYSLEKEYDFITKGNKFHNTGDFERADSNYIAALTVNPRSLVASFNTGVNAVRTIIGMELMASEGQLPDSIMEPMYTRARSSFQNSAGPKILKGDISSKAFYNLGNLSFSQKDYRSAIEEYKEALRLNPGDDQARRNLRIAQLQKNDNNQNNRQQQNQQQQNQQQNQQQQQQQKQDRQNINNETSEQILQAAERKENLRRMQMQTEKNDNSTRTSGKKW